MKPVFLLVACFAAAGLLAAEETIPPSTAPGSPATVPAAPAAEEQILRPPEPGRFQPLFQPFRTNTAALSPDGKYLAYSVREDASMSVVVIEVDRPTIMKAKVKVLDDENATEMFSRNQYEKTPARINWMRWVSTNRLVLETNQVFSRNEGKGWQNWHGAIVAFDADGSNAKVLAGPDDLKEIVIAFGPQLPSDAVTAIDNGVTPSVSTTPLSIDRGNNPNARENNVGFENRVWRPDQPIPAQGEAVEARDSGSAGSTPSLLESGTEGNAGTNQPRTLHIVDLDPQRPGSVLVSANGSARNSGVRSVSLYSLNGQTGKLAQLTYDFVPNSRAALLDRQGHARLLLPNSLLASFPFHYDYTGPQGRNRAKPLDDAAGIEGFRVSPDNYFGARAIPLGFDEDPNLLYYASNLGRDTYGVYSVNLATKKPGRLALENPSYDLIPAPEAGFPDQNGLVFDRYTHQLVGLRYDNSVRTTAWFQPDLQTIQADFERKFPGRTVEITDWDQPRNRFLIATEGPADPGAFYLYDRKQAKLMEFVRRAPGVEVVHNHATLPFSYATPDGARISGLVTVPQQPRLKPIPMVVICPDFPWQRVQSDFQPEVQALASMGFVVVQLNGRGAWGLGLKQRQSLTAGYDLVQVEDVVTTVANLDKLFQVNLKRVALLGRGHGGFIALRALQAYPDKFRCAVALDAPVNLADWLEEQKWTDDKVLPHLTRAWLGDHTRLKAAPLSSSPETLTKPALMLNYPGLDGAPRRGAYLAARSFASKVRNRGGEVVFDELSTDYMRELPAARAEVFDRIEEFLNVHVYEFKVKLHDIKVLK